MLNFENLVIGSTFFAVGFALKNQNTLIIDKTSRFGFEYTDAFNNSFETIETKLSKEADELYADFKKRNIIAASHSPLISTYPAVLSKIVKDNDIKVLFRTVIVAVEKDENNYIVTVSCADGLKKIKCKNIIDTTAQKFNLKSINAVLLRNDLQEEKNDKYEVVSGEKNDVAYLKYFVDKNEAIQSAREKLFSFVKNELKGAKLVQSAYEFEYYYDKENTSSDSYKNPILSFDAGVKYTSYSEFSFSNEMNHEEYDVIVCGLGTAGSISLIICAEKGLKTLGLETESMMGGIPTVGQVLGYYYGAKGGRFESIDEKAYSNTEFSPANKLYFDHLLPDAKVDVLEKEAHLNNADIKFRAFVYDVVKTEGRVTAVKYVCNNKLYEAKCKYVVDATGEADICALAGCDTIRGRESDNKVQPFSICTLTVDKDCVRSYYCDNGYLNPNDAEDFTKTMVETYNQKMFLKDKYDNDSFFTVISPMPGTREGRHIKAVKNITFADYLSGFEGVKPLFYAYSNMDTHGTEHAFESDTYIEWAVVSRLRKKVFSVPVCIENLVPENVRGIICAGKGIGVEHDISPCVRMKRDMQKCGEAVGVIVDNAIKNNCDILDVNYENIKEELIKTKCLDEANNKTEFCIGKEKDGTKICVADNLYSDADTIYEKMKDGKLSSIAIYSAVKLGIDKHLIEWLKEDEVSYNTALALGLLGNKEALPVIRERVKTHPLMDTSQSRDDLLEDLAAIYLSAKLEDKESVDDVISLFKKSLDNEVRNQYLFFSVHAIRKFYKLGFIPEKAYVKLIDSLTNVRICLSLKEDIYNDITEQVKNYMKEVL